MEVLGNSIIELEYIQALVQNTNTLNEITTKEEHELYEDGSSITLMKEIRRNSLQKAVMSLCKRVCEAQDMKFEDTVEKVKSFYLAEDQFPEAKGLIQVIKKSSLDATSIVSLVMPEDFGTERSETVVVPVDHGEIRETKVMLTKRPAFASEFYYLKFYLSLR